MSIRTLGVAMGWPSLKCWEDSQIDGPAWSRKSNVAVVQALTSRRRDLCRGYIRCFAEFVAIKKLRHKHLARIKWLRQRHGCSQSVIKRGTGELAQIGGITSPGAEYLKSTKTWKGLGSDYEIRYDDAGAVVTVL